MIRFRLNELLAARSWTVYRLSQETGIREDVIGKYRNNQVKRAVLAHLTKMCATLDCTIGELMEYVPEKSSKAPRGKKR
jgi:DNA-binding Xre family transcriptional regulator